MSKTKENPIESVKENSLVVNEPVQEKSLSNSVSSSIADLDNIDFAALTKAKDGEDVTAEYLSGENLTEGEEIRVIFLGMTHIESMEGGLIPAVKLLTDKKVTLINANVVLVGAFADKPKGFMASITYLGKKQSSTNKTKKYDKWKVTRLLF